jgi:FtsP/CotA-like multicopper oxidase with cupredoxin domain
MKIYSKNFTIPLHTSVYFMGDAVEVMVDMGDAEGTRTIVSFDSLLQEHLHMHEYLAGKGYAPEALADLLQLRKLVDSYIRKVRASPAKSAASRTPRARPSARGKRGQR